MELLLRFCSRCFKVPSRGGHRRSLVAAIARQLDEETDDPSATPVNSRGRRTRRPPQDPTEFWASRVSMKLEEGDFRGAVRLACSEDTIAASNDATFAALQLKHPPPLPDSSIPLSFRTRLLHLSLCRLTRVQKLFDHSRSGQQVGQMV